MQPKDGVMDCPGATWREWRWAVSSVAESKAASGSTRTKARCWCLKQRIHEGESVSPMSDVGQTDVKTEVSHHLHGAHKHKPAAVHVFAMIWAPLE